jgi:alpha-beta hydrolase superfamily lysophospholipase
MSHATRLLPLLLLLPALSFAQTRVSFPTEDGGLVVADIYGAGPRGVVLAHGGRFNKESWAPQARALAEAGFRVLALDFRGYGQSRGPGMEAPMGAPLYQDVLGAARYLRGTGATEVFAVGGSMGGGALVDAAVRVTPSPFARIVLLGSLLGDAPERLTGRLLVIVTRDDANADGLRLPHVRAGYDKAPQPKQLIVLEGDAHAQFMFASDQGERVLRETVDFLKKP